MADTKVVNPSPKDRYLADAVVVKNHREMFSHPTAQQAIDMALLHYTTVLATQRPDMSGAAANHFKTAGALEFVHILKTLAEPAQVASPMKDHNLKPV